MRYEYKMACFAEFRGEEEVALKSVALFSQPSSDSDVRKICKTLPGRVFDNTINVWIKPDWWVSVWWYAIDSKDETLGGGEGVG